MNYSLFVAFLISLSVVQCRLVATPVSIETSNNPDITWTVGTNTLGSGITNYEYAFEDFNAVGVFADGTTFETIFNKRGSLFESTSQSDDNAFVDISFFFSTKYPVARYIKTYDGNAFGGGFFNQDFYVAIEESNIVTTSSGDAVFDVSDNWFIIRTDDNGVFVFLLVFIGQPGFLINDSATEYYGFGANVERWTIDIGNLEPYERRSVMFFSYLAGTFVEAQAAVGLFSSPVIDSELLSGISSADFDTIINFGLATSSNVAPVTFSHSNLCRISSEVMDRTSKFRDSRKHLFTQPWFC